VKQEIKNIIINGKARNKEDIVKEGNSLSQKGVYEGLFLL